MRPISASLTRKGVMPDMIKFAVCDDEPLMARELSASLEAYMEEHRDVPCSVRRFSSGRALLESGDSFDVVFLDVQMASPNGMDTARLLRRRGDRSLLVFVTVLKECVFDAFEVEACGYLVKPLDPGRFRQTMDRVLKSLAREAAKSIVVRRGTGCQVVPLSEIVYCEVLGRKLYLHKSDGAVIDYYDRLDSLERRVDRRFFRCHRSYLVNLDYVRGCRDGQVLLPRGESVPASRLRERELTQALLRHMKERDA